MYRAGLYGLSGLRVTNNGYKRLNTVGFGFKNLNMSLTEPDRGCKIMSLFPSYRMYWSCVSFIKKIHYKLFTHKTQARLYYCKVKLYICHIVDLIFRWYSLTSYFITVFYMCVSFFYQCANPNKPNRPTRNPFKPTPDKTETWNGRWWAKILHSRFFPGEPFWARIRPNPSDAHP